jgi:hypothetical protein
MGLFRRRPSRFEPAEPTESPLLAWPQIERPPVEYAGIATSSLERHGFTPYEFQTDGGVWVRLHDMQIVGFDYRVQPPTLTMRFVYDDPESTPPEARSTPVAVFRFSDVQVWQWEDDYDLAETPVDVRGQVSYLDYYGPTNVFSLGTVNTTLLFSTSRLAVHLEPLDSA